MMGIKKKGTTKTTTSYSSGNLVKRKNKTLKKQRRLFVFPQIQKPISFKDNKKLLTRPEQLKIHLQKEAMPNQINLIIQIVKNGRFKLKNRMGKHKSTLPYVRKLPTKCKIHVGKIHTHVKTILDNDWVCKSEFLKKYEGEMK